jgi:hypothetical protein
VKYLKIVKKEVSLLTDSESVFILKSGAEQHPLLSHSPRDIAQPICFWENLRRQQSVSEQISLGVAFSNLCRSFSNSIVSPKSMVSW